MKATRRQARSTPRSRRRAAIAPNQPHELHIRVVECSESIGNQLQLTAAALAAEAHDTHDLALARILLEACACITAVARAYELLQALDLDNEVELARMLPEIGDVLYACLDGDWLQKNEAEAASASTSWLGGEVVTVAANGRAGNDSVCVRLVHDSRGARLTVVDGADAKQGAGLRLLRAFTARFGGSLEAAALPRGASISVFLR